MVVGESAMEVKDRTEAEEERGRKREEIPSTGGWSGGKKGDKERKVV